MDESEKTEEILDLNNSNISNFSDTFYSSPQDQSDTQINLPENKLGDQEQITSNNEKFTSDMDQVGVSTSEESEFSKVSTSFIFPIWKLILLFIVSFGSYYFFWFYGTWKKIKKHKELNINPLMKTIFLFIPFLNFYVIYEQFALIRRYCREVEINFIVHPIFLFLVWIGFDILVVFLPNSLRFDSPFIVLLIGSIVFLIGLYVQIMLNKYWKKTENGLPRAKRFKAVELIVVILGLLIWLFVVPLSIKYEGILKTQQLINKGEYNQADLALDRLIKSHPKNDKFYNLKGFVLISEGENLKALSYLDTAIKLNPQNEDALNNKSWALHNIKDDQQALEYADKALKLNHLDAYAMVNEGNALVGLGKYDKSIQYFDNASKVNPRLSQSYWGKGVALFELLNYNGAIENFKTYLNFQGESAGAYRYIGESYYRIENYRQAADYFAKAIDVRSDDPFLYLSQGDAQFKLKNYDLAMENYQEAIELNSDLPDAYLGISRILVVNNNLDEALSYLKDAIQLDESITDEVINDSALKPLQSLVEFQKIISTKEPILF